MLFFDCYVGYEYAMCNFTSNKLCYVRLYYTIRVYPIGHIHSSVWFALCTICHSLFDINYVRI